MKKNLRRRLKNLDYFGVKVNFYDRHSFNFDYNSSIKSFSFPHSRGCTRMKGRHTHENIFCKYQELTNKFKVNGKITHNMTDAAAKII
jgi:hypothetical protein